MGMKRQLTVIVLAAGKSTRMGENKLLKAVKGSPMIRHVVETCLASKVNLVVVVVGHEEDKIRKALTGLNCKFVGNPDYEMGQSSSVKAGLSAVRGDADAILVMPADVARVSPEHIDRVVEDYIRHDGRIVVASHRGRLGHPILLDRSLFGEILEINEATFGLKAVVEAHRDEVRKVEVGARDVLLDIDTLRDYERFVLEMD
jgi:molybdenum cofactor cytidylyltransferase